MFNKPLLQKSETKIFKPKIFHKKLVQSIDRKNSGVLRLIKIMSKLLKISKFFADKLLANCVAASNCFNCLNMLEHFLHCIFHKLIEVLRYNWSLLKDAHVLTNCVKLYRFIFNSNEPAKVARLQKLGNQAMLNGALLIEMLNNYFNKNKKNFGRLIKRKTL